MCMYKYGNERCAHPSNMSIDCVGEEKCTFLKEKGSEKNNRFASEANGANNELKVEKKDGVIDFKLSDVNRCEEGNECSMTECGIYCQKFNRFYCSGKENCQTEEEYFDHMNKFGGIDIDRRPDI